MAQRRVGLSLNEESQRILHDVTLICTVYNEEESIEDFLTSVFASSRLPGEFIIVDGGSVDGTVGRIERYTRAHPCEMQTRLIVDPQCNRRSMIAPIAHGRNIAIRNATRLIIACTDAGCRVERNWLEHLVSPLIDDATVDVVAGWYVAERGSRFQESVAFISLVPPEAVDRDRVMPSSRSLAFRKSAWQQVGGYPETTYMAEDTAFNLLLRTAGYKFAYAPGALVRWPMKDSFRSFGRLAFRYGRGDGAHGIRAGAVLGAIGKITVGVLLLVCGIVVHAWFLALFVGFWWILVFARRWRDGIRLRWIWRFPVLLVLKATMYSGYTSGFLTGRLSRRG